MAIGGGHLYISSGLLEIIENEEELEAVIAHEIAHVERRHTLGNFMNIKDGNHREGLLPCL